MQRTLFSRCLPAASCAALVAGSTFAQITIATSNTAFNDISTTGTSIGTFGDDVELGLTQAQLTTAGFTGNQLLAAVNIYVGNNGAVLWNASSGEVGYINSTTFGTMTPANTTTQGNGGAQVGVQFVCPLWDDNFPTTGQTSNCLHWKVVTGNLILQWSNEDHYNAQGAGTVQYQMIVYGGATIASGQPLVEFVYNDTLYSSTAYQSDGGSATIGYKNWGVIGAANDVQFGLGGGTDTLGDPAFGDPSMHPKVGGWASNNDPNLPHSIVIKGANSGPVSYCTAGTSTNACLATLSGQNLSATFASPCSITAATVEGQKSGILFYGINGQVAVPWCVGGSSFLCVKTPTQRTAPSNSGGAPGSCTGSLTLDCNAYFQANPGSLGMPFAAGNVLDWQAWYRDPPSCKTTQLSNGLQITVQP